jgi:3-ketosteroid 9alpha-monooxygenase subunit B
MTGRRGYHPVRVAAVVEETADARSLVLAVPPGSAEAFTYRPGQFLTVRVPHDTLGCVARCYSLSSSPHVGDPPTITVKRVAGGYASNWICDRVETGTELEVLPPAGQFTPADFDADLLLFAGGSGITPVLSIVKSALAAGSGRVVLVYANRDERSVIFGRELGELADRHPDRLTVTHWLDRAQGPPTVSALRAHVDGCPGFDVFICGPEPYMAVVQQALAASAVPPSRVHVERFLPDDPLVTEGGQGDATVRVELDGEITEYPWAAGTRLLDLLLDRGLNPPFSCRQGNCGTCAVRVTAGKVDMLHNEILEEEDFAEGYVLACQAVPLTDRVEVTYS